MTMFGELIASMVSSTGSLNEEFEDQFKPINPKDNPEQFKAMEDLELRRSKERAEIERRWGEDIRSYIQDVIDNLEYNKSDIVNDVLENLWEEHRSEPIPTDGPELEEFKLELSNLVDDVIKDY